MLAYTTRLLRPATQLVPAVRAYTTQPIKDEVANTVGHMDLYSAGLGCFYTPVGLMQHAFHFGAVDLGLGFPAVIIGAAIAVRAITSQFYITLKRNEINMNNNKDKFQEKLTAVKLASQDATNPNFEQNITKAKHDLETLCARENFSPFKGMYYPIASIPFQVSIFLGLDKMAAADYVPLKQSSMAWIDSLAFADPYHILPAGFALSIICLTEIELRSRINWATKKPSLTEIWETKSITSPFGQYMIKTLIRTGSIAAFFFTYNSISAVPLYWITNNIITIGFNAYLRSDFAKNRHEISDRKIDPSIYIGPPISALDLYKSYRHVKKLNANEIVLNKQIEYKRPT